MIPYRTERGKNGIVSIYIQCPRCGKEGKLLLDGIQFSGRAYKIYHVQEKKWCHIAASSELRPAVDEVYLYVRRGERVRSRETAFSLYPNEDKLIEQMRRRCKGRIPSRSEIVRRAIRLLAMYEGIPSEE